MTGTNILNELRENNIVIAAIPSIGQACCGLLRLVGERTTRDVAARPFECLARPGATAHPRMQAEAVRIGAQSWRSVFAATDYRPGSLRAERVLNFV